jgi:hypothetical protein
MFYPNPNRRVCSGCGGFTSRQQGASHKDYMFLCAKCTEVEQSGGLRVEVGMRVFLKGFVTPYAVLAINGDHMTIRQMDKPSAHPFDRPLSDVSYRSVWF